MEGAVYNASVAYYDRLEEILFPFLVPVLILRFADRVGQGSVCQREVGYELLQCILVKE